MISHLASNKSVRCQKYFEAPKSSHWNFLVVWDQNFSAKKRDIQRCIHISFSPPEFVWNNEEIPINFLGTVTQRISTWKGDIPPIGHKHFKYQKFSVNLKVPPKAFSALWDEKRRRKFVIPPSRLPNYFFPLQKFSGKQKWQLTKISYRSCEAKFSRQNLIFPSFAWKLSGKTSEPQSFPQWFFYGTLRQKKFDGETWYAVSYP